MNLSLRILCFFALALTCASDEQSVEKSAILAGRSRSLLQTGKTVLVQNQKQLGDAFDALEAGTTVVLSFDTVKLPAAVTVAVENVTIQGSSATPTPVVQCPDTASALVITADNCAINNVIFEGCKLGSAVVIDPRGFVDPAIAIASGPSIRASLDNTLFRDNDVQPQINFAHSYGGALFVGVNAVVTVTNSKFLRNKAGKGGAIYVSLASLRIDKSEFEDNVGVEGGGALLIDGAAPYKNFTVDLNVTNSNFTKNMVMIAKNEDPSTVDGKRPEPFVYFDFDFPGKSHGGAIMAADVTGFSVTNCMFRKNIAPAGGAISALVTPDSPGTDQQIQLSNSTFLENKAIVSEGLFVKEDLAQGGALFLAVTVERVGIRVDNCVFKKNKAVYGGAVDIVTDQKTKGTMDKCIFDGNKAEKGGGAVVLRNTLFTWTSIDFTRNRAEMGGAVLLTNNVILRLLGPQLHENGTTAGNKNSRFEDNTAVNGGAILCAFCGDVLLQGPEFFNNSASRNGGAVSVLDGISNVQLQEAKFFDNKALRGGGAYVDTTTSFRLESFLRDVFPTRFERNTAVSGGGLYVLARNMRQNNIQITAANFIGNEATPDEGFMDDLSAIEEDIIPAATSRNLLQLANGGPAKDSDVDSIGSCGVGGGGGLCLVFDQIPETATAQGVLDTLRFEGNRADVGGGMYAAIEGRDWTHKTCPNNPSLATDPCRSLRMLAATFINNVASFGGGGMFISEPTTGFTCCETSFSCGSRLDVVVKKIFEDPAARKDKGTCVTFKGNRVEDSNGVFGPDIATGAVFLKLAGPEVQIVNQTSGALLMDGMPEPRPEILLEVRDAFNQTITGGIPASETIILLNSTAISGKEVYRATKGRVNINETTALGMPQEYSLVFEADGLQPVRTSMKIRECFPGEEQISKQEIFTCNRCEKDFYTFDPSVPCRECEKNAECAGGATLVPKPGFWHSTPFSPQFHECIVRDACKYDNRTQDLAEFFSIPSSLRRTAEEVLPDVYKQCRNGYTGILCGSCEPDYGHLPGGECVECTDENGSTTMFFLFLLALWSFLLISAEILNSITKNRQFLTSKNTSSDSKKTDTEPVQQGTVAVNLMLESQGRSNEITARPVTGKVQKTEKPDVVIPEDMETSDGLTATVKIFINYLQITGVGVTINIKWLSGIGQLLKFEESLAGISNGSSIFPLDCTLDDDSPTPKSIRALWIRVMFPVFLLLAFLFLSLVFWYMQLRKQRKNPNRQGPKWATRSTLVSLAYIVTITTVFFAYHNTTEELMRTVNCTKLDELVEDDPFGEFSIHVGGRVWAEDTNLACFKGKHLPTAITGITFLFFFSLGFIVYIPWLMLRNYDKLNKSAIFIARYGFLYRAYRTTQHTVWWEAVITIRKALISAAVVYAYPLGPNLQALLVLGVLIMALVFHLIFKPFRTFNVDTCCGVFGKMPLTRLFGLNYLEAFSLLMSTSIFYAGTIFNEGNASDVGKWTLGVFVFIMNVLYILYMVARISGAVVAVCHAKLRARNVSFEEDSLFYVKVWKLIRSCFGHGGGDGADLDPETQWRKSMGKMDSNRDV